MSNVSTPESGESMVSKDHLHSVDPIIKSGKSFDSTLPGRDGQDDGERTDVDLLAKNNQGTFLPAESNQGAFGMQLDEDFKPARKASNSLSGLPKTKKDILTLIFCVAMFVDVAGVTATFVMTEPIAKDLSIQVNNEAWILGTYSMVFAAFLLFGGRLADLYPPHRVFIVGFSGLSIFYLIISFMTNKYAYFVFRSVSAVFAVLTIPSAINMLVQMFPDPEEQAKRLALFGMAGALANTIALIVAGVFLLASWRWYFRFITILVVPFSAAAWYLLPKTEAVAEELPGAEKWKRMDLGGVFVLCAMLILFVLAFTQAPISGWSSAIFIAPLVISLFLFPVFLIWERRLPLGYALLPHDLWSYPNILVLSLQASSIFMWFATVQLRIATYLQAALGNSAILAAVKLLPMGITALIIGVLSQAVPGLITRPRYVQVVASAFCFTGSMLFAFSNGGDGEDYWRFMFPGQIIGTGGGMLIFIGGQTNIVSSSYSLVSDHELTLQIQSFPVEFAGVGGSFAQIIFQVGAVIGISVQQGLLSTGNGTIQDWTGSKNGYFFTAAYMMTTGLIFVIFYRQRKMPHREATAVAV